MSQRSSGADKNVENDEPLVCSSSSDEDEPDGETRQAITRKRGHTPLDLANCQKVIGSPAGCVSSSPVSLSPNVLLVASGEEPVELQKQSEVRLFQQ